MHINKVMVLIAAIAIVAGAGCRRTNEAKERVRAEREKWEASLPDSIENIKRQTDSIRAQIRLLGQQLETILPDFDYVDNPREVEGYYIAKAWKDTYPLQTTGLRARLSKGERLELIATLAGGAHFDRLRIEAGGITAETSAVAHDQALNYRMEKLNTVCFSDSAANSCAKAIAEAGGQAVNITYLDGDRTTGRLVYPAKDREVMTLTWELFETRREISYREHLLPLLAKKGAIISQRIETLKEKQQQTKD